MGGEQLYIWVQSAWKLGLWWVTGHKFSPESSSLGASGADELCSHSKVKSATSVTLPSASVKPGAGTSWGAGIEVLIISPLPRETCWSTAGWSDVIICLAPAETLAPLKRRKGGLWYDGHHRVYWGQCGLPYETLLSWTCPYSQTAS